MADLVLVSVIIGFTALCTAYISWCDRIIGPDAVADEQVSQ
ncbi:MAG: potassium transporter Trk [Ilumatobacteraceae bacterium]